MSIDLSSHGGTATLSELDRYTTGPLLLATDGSISSDAAFPAALLIAEQMQAKVEVLSVVEPVPLFPDYPVSGPTPFIGQSVSVEPLRRRATEQVRSLGESSAAWPIDVELGNPVGVITREVRERSARMIIIGLNHHDAFDRLFWGDTMLGLVRRGDAPVLAVSPGLKSLPRRVVIAVDFSRSSTAALRAALMVVEGQATIYLAHVKVASELPLSDIALWESEYDLALPTAFERITAGVEIPAGIHIQTVTLRGNAPKEILELAKSTNADLIVAGSHGRGAIRRMIVGSVATHLLRGTPCSIMIVPRAATAYLGRETHEVIDYPGEPIETANWPRRLKEFTQRNIARHAVLEIDDPEIGSQAEVTDYPFLGVDFDRHSGRVEIMLGDPEPDGRHLTHSTTGVTSIDVLIDSNNKDAVLRLAHGTGQTLLTFL